VDNMIAPVTNATNFISVIDPDLCAGCGICVDLCHTYAAFLGDDGKARRKEQLCIGCGVCAANCPENAISLVKGPLRIVRIPPRRKKT
jgi:MinD superfamily P-loop ATPase